MRKWRTWACIASWLLLATAASCPALANAHRPAALPRAQVEILQSGRVVARLRVEVAATMRARARGLMFRKKLERSEGMLLLWPSPRRVAIWMHNTYLPLDIVFIDEHGRVTRVHENARPLDARLIPSRSPVIAVLEVAAGMARKFGLGRGAMVRLPHLSAQRTPAP